MILLQFKSNDIADNLVYENPIHETVRKGKFPHYYSKLNIDKISNFWEIKRGSFSLPEEVILDQENKGIYHYCSNDNCSRYEFALKIRDFVNSTLDIYPISSPINSIRPAFSALDPSKFCSTFGAKSSDWKSRLGFFIKPYNLHELNL